MACQLTRRERTYIKHLVYVSILKAFLGPFVSFPMLQIEFKNSSIIFTQLLITEFPSVNFNVAEKYWLLISLLPQALSHRGLSGFYEITFDLIIQLKNDIKIHFQLC